MFRIKICGVRTIQDVENVANSGADAIGLNFFPPSIRFLPPSDPSTPELSKHASRLALFRVGVMVNLSIADVKRLMDKIELDAIQLHGDEPSETATDWCSLGLPIIRAVKLPTKQISPSIIDRIAKTWIDAGCHPLFDADAGKSHGGVGKKLDWDSIKNWRNDNPGKSFTLAGGLTPENVAEAIEKSGANSVDTASGVERPKGIKDGKSIQRFVAACSPLF